MFSRSIYICLIGCSLFLVSVKANPPHEYAVRLTAEFDGGLWTSVLVFLVAVVALGCCGCKACTSYKQATNTGAPVSTDDRQIALQHRADVAECINYERSKRNPTAEELARQLVYLGVRMQSAKHALYNGGDQVRYDIRRKDVETFGGVDNILRLISEQEDILSRRDNKLSKSFERSKQDNNTIPPTVGSQYDSSVHAPPTRSPVTTRLECTHPSELVETKKEQDAICSGIGPTVQPLLYTTSVKELREEIKLPSMDGLSVNSRVSSTASTGKLILVKTRSRIRKPKIRETDFNPRCQRPASLGPESECYAYNTPIKTQIIDLHELLPGSGPKATKSKQQILKTLAVHTEVDEINEQIRSPPSRSCSVSPYREARTMSAITTTTSQIFEKGEQEQPNRPTERANSITQRRTSLSPLITEVVKENIFVKERNDSKRNERSVSFSTTPYKQGQSQRHSAVYTEAIPEHEFILDKSSYPRSRSLTYKRPSTVKNAAIKTEATTEHATVEDSDTPARRQSVTPVRHRRESSLPTKTEVTVAANHFYFTDDINKGSRKIKPATESHVGLKNSVPVDTPYYSELHTLLHQADVEHEDFDDYTFIDVDKMRCANSA